MISLSPVATLALIAGILGPAPLPQNQNLIAKAQACPYPVPVVDTGAIARAGSTVSGLANYAHLGTSLVGALSEGNLGLGLRTLSRLPGIPQEGLAFLRTGQAVISGDANQIMAGLFPQTHTALSNFGLQLDANGKINLDQTQAINRFSEHAGFSDLQRELTHHVTRCTQNEHMSCNYDPMDAVRISLREQNNYEALQLVSDLDVIHTVVTEPERINLLQNTDRILQHMGADPQTKYLGNTLSQAMRRCGVRPEACDDRRKAMEMGRILEASGMHNEAEIIEETLQRSHSNDPWTEIQREFGRQGVPMGTRVGIEKLYACPESGHCGPDNILDGLDQIARNLPPEQNPTRQNIRHARNQWHNPDRNQNQAKSIPDISRIPQQVMSRLSNQIQLRQRIDEAMKRALHPDWGEQDATRAILIYAEQDQPVAYTHSSSPCKVAQDLQIPTGTPNAIPKTTMAGLPEHPLDALYVPYQSLGRADNRVIVTEEARQGYALETAMTAQAQVLQRQNQILPTTTQLEKLQETFLACEDAACQARALLDLERVRTEIQQDRIRLELSALELTQALTIHHHDVARMPPARL